MAEINLKEILNKHQFENKAFLTSNEFHMIDKEVIPLYERALDESVKQLMKTQKERNEWKEKYEKLKNETDKRTKRKINK